MPRVEDLVSSPLTELATVICSPSRIHAPPRPQTTRVWNGDQRSRSSWAGIRLRIGRAAGSAILMETPLGRSIPDGHARLYLHRLSASRSAHPPDVGKAQTERRDDRPSHYSGAFRRSDRVAP